MYVYQKDLAGEVTSWKCKARVKLDRNNAFLQEVNEHTHPPTQTKVEVVKVKVSIKRRAEISLDTL